MSGNIVKRIKVEFLLVFILLFQYLNGNDELEGAYARCCVLGVNWARESKSCKDFPSPVPGELPEYQAICRETAPLCCLRFYRDEECSKGKISAQKGEECLIPSREGGEFYRDCCNGCKLGLLSSTLGHSCTFKTFNFGFPWDNAFYFCCAANSVRDLPNKKITSDQGPYRPVVQPDGSTNNQQLYPDNGPIVADSENLCLKFPGQLCGQVCIPTIGSYRCACRAGFTLSLDGKTCVQDHVSDRCQINNPCQHICRDTGMSIECSCNLGYNLAIDQRSCRDIDECRVGSHSCLPDQACYNQPGTYACINSDGSLISPGQSGWRPGLVSPRSNEPPKIYPGTNTNNEVSSTGRCPPGYKFNLESMVCDDIDECNIVDGICWGGPSTCQNTIGSYTCTPIPRADCPPGYHFVLDHQSCLDIDECANSLHDCDKKSQVCVNNLGGFTCKTRESPTECPAGYKFDESSATCEDIDECKDGIHLCNPELEKCINEPGGYACKIGDLKINNILNVNQTNSSTITDDLNVIEDTSPICPPGYRYNTQSKSCEETNDCLPNPCDTNEICLETPAGFRCICKDGYKKHSVSGDCVDVNECVLGLHTCSTTQRCDNTAGSYICVRMSGCGSGYTLNHDTGQCEDNDECELGTDDCKLMGPMWVCVNKEGSHTCEKKKCPDKQILIETGECIDIICNPGYTPFKKGCIDLDECQENPSPCKQNEICLNMEGSYRCRPRLNCGPGFKMNDFGTACIDIDECADNTHLCIGGQECVNRPGDYVCQCPKGYRINDQRECEDINECLFYYGGVCSSNSDCENTPGSYRCNCKDGYRKSKDGRICIDIDECDEVPGICHHGCINVGGSYVCKCKAGFLLSKEDNRTCTDIDECEEFKGRGRLCLGICVNNQGSFSCKCPPGYTLASDGRTCKDINECETGSPCRSNDEICVNTRGGHKCNLITCPHNYERDPQHTNRCKRTNLYCRENDHGCLNQPLSYAYNFYSLAKDLNLPPNGQADLFTMRGPPWTSRTVDFDLQLESARSPTGITAATRNSFLLKRTAYNQAVISLLEPLEGPQEVQLVLNMKLYHNGIYKGSALAKLLIYVSEYDF